MFQAFVFTLAMLTNALGLTQALEAFGQEIQTQKEGARVLTTVDLNQLQFLEGRWSGRAPDGSTFYEAYDFPDEQTFRSRRYPDATFTTSTDGSTVTLTDGKLISAWGEYTWEASEIGEGFVEFRPLNAPSAFSWRRLDTDTVEVTQNWTDEAGARQTYSLFLNRIP